MTGKVTAGLLTMVFGLSLLGNSAEAWPGRRAWVKQKMWQNLDNTTPNNIQVSGIDLGLLCAYYKGPCSDNKFPYVNPFGITYRGLAMATLKWHLCDTPRYTYRWIGIGCNTATTASGITFWNRDDNLVNVGPPFAGVAFNSPISLCGMNAVTSWAQPIVYENVRYALLATRPALDLDPDVLQWLPTSMTLPVTVQPNGSVLVGGLPSDTVIGHQSVLLYGTIRGSYTSADTIGWHLKPGHRAEFVVAIYDTLTPVDVDERRGEHGFHLGEFWPHPITDVSTLSFSIPRTEQVRLTIYDLAGRRIRTLLDLPLVAGEHRTTWDGCDETGRHVAAGLYLVCIAGRDQIATRKALVVQ